MRGRLLHLLKERTATDGQACRTCAILLLALSLVIALPAIVIDLLMGGKALKMIGYILTREGDGIAINLLVPMLVTFLLPALIATVLGVALLLYRHDRRHCGKLLLWYVGFSIFMLLWPLLPIPWRAFGMNPAYASWLNEFSWAAIMGLTVMEGWAVFVHVPAIALLWCLSLFVGWNSIVQPGKERLGPV